MKLFDLSHFKEKCPIEARNYFNEIILKLEKIEKRLDSIESSFNKQFLIFENKNSKSRKI